MTETEFIRFYKKKIKLRNVKEVQERIDTFWKTIFKALEIDGKVTFKDWEVFEKRKHGARRYILASLGIDNMTENKEVIKFRAGKGFENKINKEKR